MALAQLIPTFFGAEISQYGPYPLGFLLSFNIGILTVWLTTDCMMLINAKRRMKF
jgi:hypothetical protein